VRAALRITASFSLLMDSPVGVVAIIKPGARTEVRAPGFIGKHRDKSVHLVVFTFGNALISLAE
jgi:hypothetical protein